MEGRSAVLASKQIRGCPSPPRRSPPPLASLQLNQWFAWGASGGLQQHGCFLCTFLWWRCLLPSMQITLSQGFGMSGAARSCVLGIEGYSLNRGEAPSPASCTLPACLPPLLGWSQPPLHLFAEKELSSPSPPPHRSRRDHSHWEALSLIVILTNLAAANKSHPPAPPNLPPCKSICRLLEQ